MLALSTSWISTKIDDAQVLLQTLERLPISGIELEYRISEATFQQMRSLLQNSRLKVVSVHNFFPKPEVKPGARANGDFFMLSSLDPDERRCAVELTRKTIEHAAEFGARTVVLHCGRVEMKREIVRLYKYYNSHRMRSKRAQDFISRKQLERDRLKPPHMESLLLSLESLSKDAEKHGILLGLENRFHYDELPTLDDFEWIFSRLNGSPIGYWHDTGHAHVNEQLTIVPAGSLLRNYADKLIGVHLHDAIGLEDHLAPGTGEIDFKPLKSCLKPDTLKVAELKPQTPEVEVLQGVRFIQEKII
jgi:sugar phosphate isomerase/epimerase